MRTPWAAIEARPAVVATIEEQDLAGGGASPDVIVRLLGPFELAVAGAPVRRWTSLKGLTILKYLLLNGGRARREELMDLLWRGYRPQSARNNLNVAIYAVRRDFAAAAGGAALLVYAGGCYVLSPELVWRIDLDTFGAALADAERSSAEGDGELAADCYRRAIALYRGALLEDEAHGEWHLHEQRIVEERYLAAAEALAGLRLEAADAAEAIGLGERVLHTDPCRESAHRLLMRCFARQQQGQLVARQYRRCHEALGRELGLRPAGETRRLYQELTGAVGPS
jgi:DNA-binding SARP family transcriptional activator